MFTESFIEELRAKYPGTFEGWDGYEALVTARNREGDQGIMVTLYNKGTDFVVDVHAVFILTMDEKIRVGGVDLIQEFNSCYIPEEFRG